MIIMTFKYVYIPGEVDVVAPLELHLLVLRALGVHELLGVGAGGAVGRRRGGRRVRARRARRPGAAPRAAPARLAPRAPRRVHRQPALQQRAATELEPVVRQRLYACNTTHTHSRYFSIHLIMKNTIRVYMVLGKSTFQPYWWRYTNIVILVSGLFVSNSAVFVGNVVQS